ncbi:MAG: DUF2723 domain-containing protein, partial [Candidatus Methylomirabilis sp.]|nr:DUF2723 domain-containing protein [Deltaproteobacteria bacterium]
MGIAFFALYAFTACPTIFWKDSAEFVAVAHFLDVAHPAGSPAYALLAKLLSLLPISDIAGRVNLFSSLTAAAAVSILFLLCREALLAAETPPGRAALLAAGAAAAFGLGAPFWILAATAEVYPLATCFFA